MWSNFVKWTFAERMNVRIGIFCSFLYFVVQRNFD